MYSLYFTEGTLCFSAKLRYHYSQQWWSKLGTKPRVKLGMFTLQCQHITHTEQAAVVQTKEFFTFRHYKTMNWPGVSTHPVCSLPLFFFFFFSDETVSHNTCNIYIIRYEKVALEGKYRQVSSLPSHRNYKISAYLLKYSLPWVISSVSSVIARDG